MIASCTYQVKRTKIFILNTNLVMDYIIPNFLGEQLPGSLNPVVRCPPKKTLYSRCPRFFVDGIKPLFTGATGKIYKGIINHFSFRRFYKTAVSILVRAFDYISTVIAWSPTPRFANCLSTASIMGGGPHT